MGKDLFWFLKKSSFDVHIFHLETQVYLSLSHHTHIPDKILEHLCMGICFPSKYVSFREEIEGRVFNFCRPPTKAFPQWNFMYWNILFLIKSSKHENAWCRMVWSWRPSLEKMLSSCSWNKIKLKCNLNQHFKTSL